MVARGQAAAWAASLLACLAREAARLGGEMRSARGPAPPDAPVYWGRAPSGSTSASNLARNAARAAAVVFAGVIPRVRGVCPNPAPAGHLFGVELQRDENRKPTSLAIEKAP